jgi:hypothetical protein
MFENLRRSLRDMLGGATTPEDRRAVLAQMRDTLVQAKVGLHDLREGVTQARERLEAERRELETVRRRGRLAAGIGDQETVAIAARYEVLHGEKVAVLERRVAAQEAELAVAEREVAEMTAELKRAAAGIGVSPPAADPIAGAATAGGGAPDGTAGSVPGSETTDPLHDPVGSELEALARARERSARERAAEEQLAALKRRMGK